VGSAAASEPDSTCIAGRSGGGGPAAGYWEGALAFELTSGNGDGGGSRSCRGGGGGGWAREYRGDSDDLEECVGRLALYRDGGSRLQSESLLQAPSQLGPNRTV
jgi:hypothetical protein